MCSGGLLLRAVLRRGAVVVVLGRRDDDELNINPPTPCQIGKRPPAPKPKEKWPAFREAGNPHSTRPASPSTCNSLKAGQFPLGFGAGGRLKIWHGVGGFMFNSSSSGIGRITYAGREKKNQGRPYVKPTS